MNDLDYDAMQKKRIAQGAKHMKKRQHGCRLRTDNMTNKQIAKMHGEVVTVNLNEKISWEEFKKLSKDTQELYYDTIVDRFAVGQAIIARNLFKIPQATLSSYIWRNGLNVRHVKRCTKNQLQTFIAFCNPAETHEERTENAPATHEERTKNARTEIARVQFEFKNVEDFSTLARDLKVFIPAGANVTIIAEV